MGTLSSISPKRDGRRYLRNVLLSGARFFLVVYALAGLGLSAAAQALATSSTATPLLLPTSIAFDAAGNLYFAETNHHVVRKVDLTGLLTTVAGDGTQGFSGDGGPAVVAQFDSPTGIAFDTAGNLYIADSHNDRVRRVDALSGLVATVAGTGMAGFTGDGGLATQARLSLPSALAIDVSGNLFVADVNNHRIRKVAANTGVIATIAGVGLQGFSGDGGPATAATLDSPDGLAVDGAGNLYLTDTRNHRVRVVRAGTGVISTLAGTGASAFSGDNAFASGAALALPHDVSVDASGNVYIADTNNHRLRRISAQGTITTVAGDGVQALAGDGGLAVLASLNTPRGTALSPGGLATLGDTGNQRVRQVQADGTIVTLAGLGAATVPSALKLSGPATTVYGTGVVTAALVSATPATGSVTFLESGASSGALGSVVLAAGIATLNLGGMPVGTHTLYASYAGDLLHSAAQSAPLMLTISAAPVVATTHSATILYGQAIPSLAGTLSGVLPQDANKVGLMLGTSAAALSPVGSYSVSGSLTGPAAGNYSLAPLTGATLTITKAPTTTTLSVSATLVVAGQSLGLSLHVASTTSGTPTGGVTLLDGGNTLATLPLSQTGNASYSSSTLAAGTHTLTAVYTGDGNFVESAAAEQTVAVGTAVPADFTLAATGPTSQTVAAGTTVTFPFTVQMQGLSSPVTLSTSALPAGLTANFSPAYLPPGGAVTAFTLTVQAPTSTLKASAVWGTTLGFALLLLPWLGLSPQRKRLFAAGLSLMVLVTTTGCGARVFAVASASSTGTSYPITVSGTATTPTGAALVHSAVVTVVVQ